MRDQVQNLFELSAEADHLVEALTHPSYANERPGTPDNQRLEFIGDAVLGLCTSEILFQRFPTADEGGLTRMRSQLVNADALAAWAKSNSLSEDLLLGKGAESAGLRGSVNVLADAVEALIAATYLDSGLDAARRVCARIVDDALHSLGDQRAPDPKSALQELVQARGARAPTYEVVDSGGPAHARWFEVGVCIDGTMRAVRRGRSKRLAERFAAEAALEVESGAATGAQSTCGTSQGAEADAVTSAVESTRTEAWREGPKSEGPDAGS